VTATYIFSSE